MHWAVVRHLRSVTDVSHLCAFFAPCAIVELTERMRKLDNRTTMCFFVGYKYERDGYQVWDPKRRAVVESRFLAFAYRRPHLTIRVHSPLTTTSRLYNLHLTTPLRPHH